MTSPAPIVLLAALVAVVCAAQGAQAACPFDDSSCQEYCNQQGCNLGYCGHFAWIQCICRKCGDEWNWYDKVHYNPNKQVNQTELHSLKLNGSAPIILTNTDAKRPEPVAQQVAAAAATSGEQSAPSQQQTRPAAAPSKPEQPKVPATLTTLLIPDLSDGSKLDLNDIPDENSEKFLDYLTKNHEKLVQATSQKLGSAARSSSLEADGETKGDAEDLDSDESEAEAAAGSADGDQQAEEAVEIQISSSNNNQPQTTQQTTTAATTQAGKSGRSYALGEPDSEHNKQQHQPTGSGPTMRLLRMAVANKSPDDIL